MSNFSFAPMRIADVVLIASQRYVDHRGYLTENYEREAFRDAGILSDFVQDNQSFSTRRGTVRGLHYQLEPAAQAKLVRVLTGAVFDVAVDLRRNSATYGQWCGAELTANDGRALFVPRGFAHGFCTLVDETAVAYKLDAAYAKARERGVAWNDPTLAIDWPVGEHEAILSDRDRALPELAEAMAMARD